MLSRLAADDAVVSRPLPREERSVEGKVEGKAEGKDGGGGDADRLTDADEGKGARARGEEDDAFDQELIDAACVVDREISSTLEQMVRGLLRALRETYRAIASRDRATEEYTWSHVCLEGGGGGRRKPRFFASFLWC